MFSGCMSQKVQILKFYQKLPHGIFLKQLNFRNWHKWLFCKNCYFEVVRWGQNGRKIRFFKCFEKLWLRTFLIFLISSIKAYNWLKLFLGFGFWVQKGYEMSHKWGFLEFWFFAWPSSCLGLGFNNNLGF